MGWAYSCELSQVFTHLKTKRGIKEKEVKGVVTESQFLLSTNRCVTFKSDCKIVSSSPFIKWMREIEVQRWEDVYLMLHKSRK